MVFCCGKNVLHFWLSSLLPAILWRVYCTILGVWGLQSSQYSAGAQILATTFERNPFSQCNKKNVTTVSLTICTQIVNIFINFSRNKWMKTHFLRLMRLLKFKNWQSLLHIDKFIALPYLSKTQIKDKFKITFVVAFNVIHFFL